jgi:hypothetical protein
MRPSLRHTEIEAQGARPMPREFHLGQWVAIVIIIALLIIFMI